MIPTETGVGRDLPDCQKKAKYRWCLEKPGWLNVLGSEFAFIEERHFGRPEDPFCRELGEKAQMGQAAPALGVFRQAANSYALYVRSYLTSY